MQTLAFVAGGLGPTVAAVILLGVQDTSLRAWGRDTFRVRLRPAIYLVAILVPLLALVGAGGLHVTVLGAEPTVRDLPPLVEYPIYLAFVLLFGGGQEEPGWRGYLVPTLQSRYSGLATGLIVGTIWALWHLPLFVIPGTVHADLAIWLYVPQLLGLSVVLTWLRNTSRGSVVPAMVLHAGGNAILNYYPVGGPSGATTQTGFGLLTGAVVVVAVLVVVFAGPDLGRSPDGQDPWTG